MTKNLSRRGVLKGSLLAASAGWLAGVKPLLSEPASSPQAANHKALLNLNESAFGPSPRALAAIQSELPRIAHYATDELATAFIKQAAEFEGLPAEQIVPGEVLTALGSHLAARAGAGAEFLYAAPGYLALVEAAHRAGGRAVAVPLNAQGENDLAAFEAAVTTHTAALYLINPHNPTGTVSDANAFKEFLRRVSKRAPVIVDEAYLEFASDYADRTAAPLVREGHNIIVFRTFDKIHGLAGLPMGYAIAPAPLAEYLRTAGVGDAEALGRLNLVAASASLHDQAHVAEVRHAIAGERAQWHALFDALKLAHSLSTANFVFFDARKPHDEVAAQLAAKGIIVARSFAPYTNWVRITIGTAEENAKAREAVRALYQ